MSADLAQAAVIAAQALAAVVAVLLLAGAALSLLARLAADPAPAASQPAGEADEQALRARAAAAATAVALAQRRAAPAPPPSPPSLSAWQVVNRTAALVRWRPRR